MHGTTLNLSYIIHKIIDINSKEQLSVKEKKKKKKSEISYLAYFIQEFVLLLRLL